MGLKHEEVTGALIGCAMAVHRELGPGLEEPFYHTALHRALVNAGIDSRYKPNGRLVHRGHAADKFEADLILAEQVIVELKALSGPFAPAHFAQIITYLKFWQREVGMLMDFGKEKLIWERVAYTPVHPGVEFVSLPNTYPPAERGTATARMLLTALQRVYDAHGLGYPDTTYRGLACAELTAEGIAHQACPTVEVLSAGQCLGSSTLGCIVVGDDLVLQIEALHECLRPRDRAVLQAHLRRLKRPLGLLVNFGKRHVEARYVWV